MKRPLVSLKTEEALTVGLIGVAVGMTLTGTVLTIAGGLAAGMILFVVARLTLRVQWSRRGTRTDVEIMGRSVSIDTKKSSKRAAKKAS